MTVCAMRQFWLATGRRVLLLIAPLLLVMNLGVATADAMVPGDSLLAIATYQLPAVSAGEDTWIVDEAKIISRLNEGKISKRLAQLSEDTGKEVRLVTIHHFDYGETIDSFTDKLFEAWYPTPELQANQVLLVLDELTKVVGIRVGPNAAELLPPGTAESVAQETVLVPLLEGDKYNQALLDGTDRMVAILSGEADPGPPAFDDSFDAEGTFATAEETDASRNNSTILLVVLLVLATAIPMATYFFYQFMGS